MFDIFQPIQALLKLNNARIDNNIFSLHYRLTVIILVASALIIGSRKYFGDPIDCTASTAAIGKIVDNFCWFNSYILVPKDPNKPFPDHGGFGRYQTIINSKVQNYEQLLGPNSPYPGVKPYFLHVYQWIEFILFFQAMLFFLPRYLWRYVWEQGRVKGLTTGLSQASTASETDKARVTELVQYFHRLRPFDQYDYAGKFVICEVFNFVNVVAQFVLVKTKLGLEPDVLFGDFLSSESNVDPTHPINMAFPNLARCEVPGVAGAGHHYSLEFCVLPLNVFVTKIYIFLWFHFLALAVVTGFSLVYRLIIITVPPLRCLLLRREAKGLEDNCVSAVKDISYGQWFMLSLVGKNMDPFTFKALVKEYNDAILNSKRTGSLLSMEKIYNPQFGSVELKKSALSQ